MSDIIYCRELPNEVLDMKNFLNCTPRTALQLSCMGYRTISDLRKPGVTPELMVKQLHDIFKIESKYDYTKVFRKFLWWANASDEERKAHPEMLLCSSWTKAAIAKRERESKSIKEEGDDGKRKIIKEEGDDGKRKSIKEEGDDGKRKSVKEEGDDGKRKKTKNK